MKKAISRNVIVTCIAFGLLFLVSSLPAMAQNTQKSAKTEALEAAAASEETLKPAAPGTYQILAKDANSHEVFPVDILLEIEKNRDQKKVVYLNAGKSSVIRILPYREINAKNFVPVPEYGVQE